MSNMNGYSQEELQEALRIVRDFISRQAIHNIVVRKAMSDLDTQINRLRADMIWCRDSSEEAVANRDATIAKLRAEIERLRAEHESPNPPAPGPNVHITKSL